MFSNSYQSGFVSIFFSVGSNPLALWDKQVKNGHIRRVIDDEVKSLVLDVGGTNVATTYITCPIKPRASLGVKLPYFVMVIKNMKKYFTFEIQILDDKDMRRRFRVSNFQSTTKVRPFCTTMPIGLSAGWNQVQFNLADFTKRAYGSAYMETVRVQIHANVRIRRIYFTDQLLSDEELPNEFKLFTPGPGTQKQKPKGKSSKEGLETTEGQVPPIKIEKKEEEEVPPPPSPAEESPVVPEEAPAEAQEEAPEGEAPPPEEVEKPAVEGEEGEAPPTEGEDAPKTEAEEGAPVEGEAPALTEGQEEAPQPEEGAAPPEEGEQPPAEGAEAPPEGEEGVEVKVEPAEGEEEAPPPAAEGEQVEGGEAEGELAAPEEAIPEVATEASETVAETMVTETETVTVTETETVEEGETSPSEPPTTDNEGD